MPEERETPSWVYKDIRPTTDTEYFEKDSK